MNGPNKLAMKTLANSAAQGCIGLGVRKAARAVARHYDQALSQVGVKGTQFTLLNALYLYPGVTLTRLADALVMDRTTLNRNLKPMVREGWINMKPGKDLRTQEWRLAKKGERKLATAFPLWHDAQQALLQKLGNRTDALRADLQRLAT